MPVPAIDLPSKDTNEVLIYGFDWTEALQGDTISSASWSIPAGLTGASAATPGGDRTTIIISGGTPGTMYTIQCTIVTAAGQTMEQTGNINIYL